MADSLGAGQKEGQAISKTRMVELCVRQGQWSLASAALKLSGEFDLKSEQAVFALIQSVEGARDSDPLWRERSGARAFAMSLIELGVDPCAGTPLAKFSRGDQMAPCAILLAIQSKSWGLASAMAMSLGDQKRRALIALEERRFGLSSASALGSEGINALLELGQSANALERGAPWAHYCKDEASLKKLAEAGADLSAVDSKGAGLEERLSKLTDAKERSLMFAYLGEAKGAKRKGEGVSESETRAVFELAGKSSKTELFKELRRLGLKPSQALDASGRSLLARAMKEGNWRGVIALLDAGLDPMRIAPSGEPEACYLLARKSINARSSSAEQKKERAAMEALQGAVPAGWRSSAGLSLAEELASNPGASDYAMGPLAKEASRKQIFDTACLLWFMRREPETPGEPLAGRFLKDPSFAYSAFRAMSARQGELFEAKDGSSVLEKGLVAYFKELLARESETSETTQLARIAMEWGGWESPKKASEELKKGSATRASPLIDRVFAQGIEILTQESSPLARDSASGGLREASWALREFAEAAKSKGWKPDFETLSPAIAKSVKAASTRSGDMSAWERPVEALFLSRLPGSARLALDIIALDDPRSARVAIEWLSSAFERKLEMVFPDSHPLFGRALPEWLAQSETWLRVEREALKSSAAGAEKRGPSLRI